MKSVTWETIKILMDTYNVRTLTLGFVPLFTQIYEQFIPFCNRVSCVQKLYHIQLMRRGQSKDPIMAQFPLALAIEPRLLPCAISNGFSMDYKVMLHLLFSHTKLIYIHVHCFQYRDFVFRKMFEKPALSSEARAEDIADNVRELCKLDPAYVALFLLQFNQSQPANLNLACS